MDQKYSEELSTLISIGPIVVYTCEAFGEFSAISITPNITEQLGYEPNEFLDTPNFWAANIHPDDQDTIFENLSTLFEKGTHNHEYRFLHRDGSYRWMHDDLRLIVDEKGQPDTIVGYWTDVTDRKRVETALEKSEKRFRDFAEMSADWFWQTNDIHQFIEITGQHALPKSWVNENILGKTRVQILDHQEDIKDRKWQMHLADLDAHKPFQNLEFRVNGNEKDVWVSITGNPIMTNDGAFLGYQGVGVNISDRKSVEMKLEKAKELADHSSQSKSNFLAAMSHEIRTPMAGIIGMVDLILDSDLSPQQLDWVSSVKMSSNNLMGILDEILDQSKLEAGKLKLAPIDFHLASFVEDTVRLFAPKIESSGLALNVELDETLPDDIHADNLRIGQILSNLVSNALKFTKTGNITVRVEQETGDSDDLQLKVTVSDSGIGLSKEAQGKLFSAFTQAENTISRTYGGTGLGLSISKQLAELMDGEIGVESIEGVGSAFWFTVNYQPAKSKVEAPDKRRSMDRWVASRSLKVLVVDDTYSNLQIMSAVLDKLKHEAIITDNGRSAVKYVEENHFDIILMDIRMPVMSGLEATKIIRSLSKDKSFIPIIALTADVTTGYDKNDTDTGINGVCTKPINLPVMLKMINDLLGEEIHTSIPAVRSAMREQQNTDTGNETTDNIGFTQVLERVSNMLDQAAGLSSDDSASLSEFAIVAGDSFTELLANYEEALKKDCAKLNASIAELAENPADDEGRNMAQDITHALIGGGDTFGYNLITSIAAQADVLLDEKNVLSEGNICALSNLAKALTLVADRRMSGNGGKAGRILLQGLKNVS